MTEVNATMTFDIYLWKAPRDLDSDGAEGVLERWESAGGDPADAPFEPSTDVGWFHRELTKDEPALDVLSDAVRNPSTRPIWLATDDEPPARIVAIRLPPGTPRDTLESILGLATKYDLVLFDARSRQIHLPLAEMAAYASATFWPRGAIQAAIAGGVGLIIAIVAWSLGIPVLSGIVALAGAFMFVMAILTFVHEGRKNARSRRS